MDEEVGKPHFIEGLTSCKDVQLNSAATMLGVTCQQLFERAYLRSRHSATYARGMFVQYMADPPHARVLPYEVADYCKKQIARKIKGSPKKVQGFCVGCMLQHGGQQALEFSYSLILGDPSTTNPASSPPLTQLETWWLDLVDSDALEPPADSWEELVRNEGGLAQGPDE